MGFEIDAFWGSMPRLSDAILVNLRIAAISIVLAVAAGTLLTVLRSFKIRPVNAVIGVCLSFIRGTPVLIQIFLAY